MAESYGTAELFNLYSISARYDFIHDQRPLPVRQIFIYSTFADYYIVVAIFFRRPENNGSECSSEDFNIQQRRRVNDAVSSSGVLCMSSKSQHIFAT